MLVAWATRPFPAGLGQWDHIYNYKPTLEMRQAARRKVQESLHAQAAPAMMLERPKRSVDEPDEPLFYK